MHAGANVTGEVTDFDLLRNCVEYACDHPDDTVGLNDRRQSVAVSVPYFSNLSPYPAGTINLHQVIKRLRSS